MANTNWNTRIILCNDETVNWGTSDKVIMKGEVALEFTASGEVKIKIGDGVKTFTQLGYTTMTPNEINEAVKRAIQTASHSHANKAILDAMTASFTTELKANYDEAYQHSQVVHAPSNAQANIIEEIKVNGVKQNPEEKSVNIKVPTKVSELNNDSGFVSKDTKYTLETPVSAGNGNAAITLKGDDSTSDSVTLKGAGATTVTTDEAGNILVTSKDTVYTHPTSGVKAGDYTKVTVDANGHVTQGINPNTLAGYGITDAVPDSHLTDSKAHEDIRKETAKLKEDIGNKAPAIIKKASGKTIIINDSSNLPIKALSGTGKIIITGKNIFKTENRNEFIPFEAKAGTLFTLITNGELSKGGNIRFTGENDEEIWFAIDKGKTRVSAKISRNVKGYTNLLSPKEGLKYCFSAGENDEYEEYVEQVITAPDSEQLKTIHTNYPTTVLTSENEISVEYVADTEAYIGKRIKEENQSLQKQILEIQNALISQKISGGYNPS